MPKIYLFTNIKSHQIQVFVFFKFNLSQIIWPGLTTLHLVETKPNVLHNIKNANKIGHRISIQYLTPPPQALTSVVKWPLLKWLKSSRKTTVCRRLRNCPGSKYFTKKTEIRKKSTWITEQLKQLTWLLWFWRPRGSFFVIYNAVSFLFLHCNG